MDLGFLNPTNWSSEPFVVLIVLTLIVRYKLPAPTNRWQSIASEVMAVGPAAFLYFLVRGFVDARFDSASANAQRIIDLERTLGIYREVELQEAVMRSDTFVKLVNWIYIWGHWPVIAGTMIWLVLARPAAYPRYRNAVLLAGALSMLIFALFPVVPPRLIEDAAFVDTVTQQSSSYRILQPPGLTNPYAAMPSLHFGWNLLMGIALFRLGESTLLRGFGLLMPPAMFLAIVLTANHYILDGVAGGLIVLISLGLVSMRQTRYRPKTSRSAPMSEQSVAITEVLPVRRPLTIAHRAGNEMESLKRAEAAGVDIVEADIWLYRGRLEVRHTKTLGRLPILWDRWSLERGNLPRFQLAELLERADPKTLLMLDLKGRNPEIASRVIDELHRAAPGRPVLVCSQNWNLLERFRDYSPATIVHSIGNRWQLGRAWPHLRMESHDAISIQFKLLDPDVTAALKEHVSLVFSWPIDSPQRLQQATDWGLDGVIVDRLDLISAHVTPADSESPILIK